MDLRDRSGGITPAEGCMFLAMLLFGALLVTLLVLAFFRFQDRPSGEDIQTPPTSYLRSGYLLSAISYQSTDS